MPIVLMYLNLMNRFISYNIISFKRYLSVFPEINAKTCFEDKSMNKLLYIKFIDSMHNAYPETTKNSNGITQLTNFEKCVQLLNNFNFFYVTEGTKLSIFYSTYINSHFSFISDVRTPFNTLLKYSIIAFPDGTPFLIINTNDTDNSFTSSKTQFASYEEDIILDYINVIEENESIAEASTGCIDQFIVDIISPCSMPILADTHANNNMLDINALSKSKLLLLEFLISMKSDAESSQKSPVIPELSQNTTQSSQEIPSTRILLNNLPQSAHSMPRMYNKYNYYYAISYSVTYNRLIPPVPTDVLLRLIRHQPKIKQTKQLLLDIFKESTIMLNVVPLFMSRKGIRTSLLSVTSQLWHFLAELANLSIVPLPRTELDWKLLSSCMTTLIEMSLQHKQVQLWNNIDLTPFDIHKDYPNYVSAKREAGVNTARTASYGLLVSDIHRRRNTAKLRKQRNVGCQHLHHLLVLAVQSIYSIRINNSNEIACSLNQIHGYMEMIRCILGAIKIQLFEPLVMCIFSMPSNITKDLLRDNYRVAYSVHIHHFILRFMYIISKHTS